MMDCELDELLIKLSSRLLTNYFFVRLYFPFAVSEIMTETLLSFCSLRSLPNSVLGSNSYNLFVFII